VGLAGDRSQDVCPGGIGAGAEFSIKEGVLSEADVFVQTRREGQSRSRRTARLGICLSPAPGMPHVANTQGQPVFADSRSQRVWASTPRPTRRYGPGCGWSRRDVDRSSGYPVARDTGSRGAAPRPVVRGKSRREMISDTGSLPSRPGVPGRRRFSGSQLAPSRNQHAGTTRDPANSPGPSSSRRRGDQPPCCRRSCSRYASLAKIATSTRRFCCRPTSSSLDAIGSCMPRPVAFRR
jgi:hypothetical protein